MSTPNFRPQLLEVIVRSFEDEPVALYAHRLQVNKKRVLVGKANAERPISLPFADVSTLTLDTFVSYQRRSVRETEAILANYINHLDR
jgi:hypothetical protein